MQLLEENYVQEAPTTVCLSNLDSCVMLPEPHVLIELLHTSDRNSASFIQCWDIISLSVVVHHLPAVALYHIQNSRPRYVAAVPEHYTGSWHAEFFGSIFSIIEISVRNQHLRR